MHCDVQSRRMVLGKHQPDIHQVVSLHSENALSSFGQYGTLSVPGTFA
jgi:hypothetical protein